MRIPSKPINEQERSEALKSYAILDTLPEEEYDRITRLAAYICGTPVALISLIDDNRQWFKSAQGTDIRETPRDIAFCAHNILDPTTALIVEDATQDERFSGSPLVTENPHIVFYAGVPIVDPDGHALGSLCVLDQKTRHLDEQQLRCLHDLTQQVVDLLVLRKANADLKQDISAKAADKDRTNEAYQKLASMLDQSPVAIATIVRENLTFTNANLFYGELVGRTPEEIIGKPLLKALPELEGQGFDNLLRGVLDTGIPYISDEMEVTLTRQHKLESIYVNLVYKPMYDDAGGIYAVLVVAVDVTAQVNARRAIQESERLFRALIEEAPVATSLFEGREQRITFANKQMLDLWGKGNSVIGKPLAKALPELEGQPFLEILDKVYTTGEAYSSDAARADLVVDGVLGTYYFNFTYQPLRNAEGEVYAIIDMAIDVTEQVLAQQQIAANEAKLRSIISTAPAAIGLFVGRDLVIEHPNQTFIDIVGKGWGVEGLPLREAMPELITEGQPFLKILDDVFTTGVPFYSTGSLVKIVQNGVMTERYYNISYSPVRDEKGEVYAILDVAIDVTDQIVAQKQAEEAREDLHSAIELAELATWRLDLKKEKLVCSPRLQEWLGLPDPECRFDSSPVIHERDRERITASLQNTITPGSDGTFDETYTIIHLPTGHQRVIHSNGRAVFDPTGNPIAITGTSQDVTMQQEMQLALKNEVRQRTEELATVVEQLQATNEELAEANERLTHSNEELAQYAYVASHDLQEPLRKIQVFSGMLNKKKELPEELLELTDKINKSANRMGLLIRDLLNFSRLLQSDTSFETVDLNKITSDIIGDFELLAKEKGAHFKIGKLPIIEAVSLQMNQLFYNLVGNAMKFTKPNVPPVISISSELVESGTVEQYISKPLPATPYYRICVEDNGIGFEKEYEGQIFEIFKRLHGREIYPGSGIGLALCRRIIENHKGCLYTESKVGEGAKFYLILPAKQN